MTDEREEALLPCPFCGGPAEVDFDDGRHHNEERKEEHRWAICCKQSQQGCPVGPMTHCTTKREAISQWNTRAQPQQEPAIYRCEHCGGSHTRRTLTGGWICDTCHRPIEGPSPPAQAVSEGWPTQEMLEAGKDMRMECFKTEGRETNPISVDEAIRRIFLAMLSAAPNPGEK